MRYGFLLRSGAVSTLVWFFLVLSPSLFGGGSLDLVPLATHHSGVFEGSASEIVAHDPRSDRVFVTNASTGNLDILQLNPTGTLSLVGFVNTIGAASHVRIWDNGTTSFVVAAVPAASLANPGTVQVFTTSGALQATYVVGALPDMLYVTSNHLVLTANEGQPVGANNPPGSVSIVNLQTGLVSTVSFTVFNGQEAALRNAGIRIFPGLSASADLEPEYIAVTPDNTTAYAVCQEQNCVVVIDIPTATATSIHALGSKDHSIVGNGLDGSDSDGGINISTWPVRGMYMPDSSVTYQVNGQNYLLTANEGDARNEAERARTLNLDPVAFPNAGSLQQNGNMGRLFVSTIDGDLDGDGDFDEIYSYGTRSFSIFNMSADAELVYDSGDEFALTIASLETANFNSNSTSNNSADGRSDNKGCEPEAVVVAQIGDRHLAFIGMERQGGIFAYDVTTPASSQLLGYFSNRNFGANIESQAAGDLGIESIVYVKPEDNALGQPLLITGNEISGTTTVFLILGALPPPDCNGNSVADPDDLSSGTSEDCNGDGIPDECQISEDDCNLNGLLDFCEIASGVAFDCNDNGLLDSCDIVAGATDCDADGLMDSCELISGTGTDCNLNGNLDICDLAAGAVDGNLDGILDSCQGVPFISGDGNQDGAIDITDAVQILSVLFGNGVSACPFALDSDGSGAADISDVVYLLDYIFQGGLAPAAPFPSCGIRVGLLGDCDSFSSCP